MRRRADLQKLLDDHLPALQPSLPPAKQAGAFDDIQSSSQRSFVFPYSTRTRPTSPAALNSVAPESSFPSPSSTQSIEGSQRTAPGSFRSALCFLRLNNPAISARPATRVPPGGALRLSYLCSLFPFSLPTPRILRCAVDAGSHYIGSEGMVSPAYQRK